MARGVLVYAFVAVGGLEVLNHLVHEFLDVQSFGIGIVADPVPLAGITMEGDAAVVILIGYLAFIFPCGLFMLASLGRLVFLFWYSRLVFWQSWVD